MEKYYYYDNTLFKSSGSKLTEVSKPLTNKELEIYVSANTRKYDSDECDLNELVRLVPNVKKLYIDFTGKNIVYNIKPLIKLIELRRLYISGGEDEDNPKLLNIDKLIKLKLKSLKIYDEKIDPTNPMYEWPKIKIKQYNHIIDIRILGCVTIYDIDASKLTDNDENNETDNIVIQRIKSDNIYLYFMISTCVEGNHCSDLMVNPIKSNQFYSIINHKTLDYKNIKTKLIKNIPLNNEKLYEN